MECLFMKNRHRAPQSLKDRRLEERAVGLWPITEELRQRVCERLGHYFDDKRPESQTIPPRQLVQAARTLLAADRLNLDHRRAQQHDQDPDLAAHLEELRAEFERRALERLQSREQTS